MGVLAGIAIGAITGILFAPENGKARRKKIFEKGTAYAEKLNTQFKDFIVDMTERFVAMTEEAEVMAEKGIAKIAKAIDHMADPILKP